ncbi:MAG: NAD-binding protein [Acidimicrobiia bacterium]|nr:NAD-binding protein [Acidimicrobiia bacterium]
MQEETVFGYVLRRMRWAIVGFVALVVVAVASYMALERYSFIDALYMTVITLGTIGFGEVEPLGTAGKLLTIVIIGFGFFLVIYTASVMSELFVSGDLRQVVQRRRKVRTKVSDHVIVVGFGRVGRSVTRELVAQGRQVVVLDTDEDLRDVVEGTGVTFVPGDGTHDDDLRAASIDAAAALTATAKDDPTNLVIVLTARALRPDLRIVSRVGFPEWTDRIRRAGADRTISPYDSAGRSLAASALMPDVVGLQDLPELGLRSEEIEVLEGSPVEGAELAEVAGKHDRLVFLAVRRGDVVHSRSDVAGPLRVGDVIMALGPPDELSALARIAMP